MTRKLSLKQIFLTKLDRVVNPKFEKKYIWALLMLGGGLVGLPTLLNFSANFKLIKDNLELNLTLSENANSTLHIAGIIFVTYSFVIFFKISGSIKKDGETDDLPSYKQKSLRKLTNNIPATNLPHYEQGNEEGYLNYLTENNKNAVALILSHPKGDEILQHIKKLHFFPDFPKLMCANDEVLENPIYDNFSDSQLRKLIANFRIGGPKKIRLMPEDIYLIKAFDTNKQPMLLQYFSGSKSAGWQTWLFPHGFMLSIPSLKERMEKNCRDFETTAGLNTNTSKCNYNKDLDYIISIKPDFGYLDTLVIYCFLITTMSINEPIPSQFLKREFRIKKGNSSRRFKWFYIDELQSSKEILIKNADMVRGVHTLFGTSLVNVSCSLNHEIV